MTCFDVTNPDHFEMLAEWCEAVAFEYLDYNSDPEFVFYQVSRVIRCVEAKLMDPSSQLLANRTSVSEVAHGACRFFFRDPAINQVCLTIAEVHAARRTAFPHIQDEWDVLLERESGEPYD